MFNLCVFPWFTIYSKFLFLGSGQNVFTIIHNFQVVEKMNFILMVKESKLLPICDTHRFISYLSLFLLQIWLGVIFFLENFVFQEGVCKDIGVAMEIATRPAMVTENLKIHANTTEQLSYLTYGILRCIWKGTEETWCSKILTTEVKNTLLL